MTDHPTDADLANRYQREAAYWREQCEALAEALHMMEPYIGQPAEHMPIIAYENIKDAWIVYARPALANYTAALIDGGEA